MTADPVAGVAPRGTPCGQGFDWARCYSGVMLKHLIACTSFVVAVLCVGTATASAQSAMDGIRAEFAAVTTSVLTAAKKAPEPLYGYQPAPEVFTMRKQFLHIADASYSICASFKGMPGQRPKVDADATASKADVLAALTASFAFCDAALTAASDSTLAEVVTTTSGAKRVKSYHASHLLAHTSLHYGNVVTYLRMNKLSPGDR